MFNQTMTPSQSLSYCS